MCFLCLQNPCHTQCPNYEPPETHYRCSSCGEGIYYGEEYIENQDGEYVHYDCLYNMKNLLNWLGLEIKTMEENYD